MSKAEYIIWRCETRDEIGRQNPTWSRRKVERYLNAIEKQLEKKGFIKKDF